MSSVYMGLLLAPTSLVEGWLARRGTTYGTVILAWLVLFGLLTLMHLQAVYGSGVLTTGTLDGGGDALFMERNRLGAPAPGEMGTLAALDNIDLLVLCMAGFAIALLCAALARPLAVAKKMSVVKMWVLLVVCGLVLGTFSVTAVLATRAPGIIAVAYVVTLFVAVAAVGPLAGTALAWILGDVAAEWPLKIVRRR